MPQPENLDIKALVGTAPWLRLRVGTYRIVFRPLSEGELAALSARGMQLAGPNGYLIERIVHRRELDQAITALH